jgi:DNA-binding IclR family transcriptional regulator
MQAPGAGRPAYPIESVDNALRLLLLLERDGQARVSDAADALGVAVSTAHRLLAMLEHHGFARQDPGTRAYLAGPALVRVGLSAVRDLELRKVAHPYLEALRDEIGETVQAAVLRGPEVVVVDAVEAPTALRVAAPPGRTMWAHCTSVGKAILAALPADHLDRLYPPEQAALPAMTARSIADRGQLLAALDRVRAAGHALSHEESDEGVGSVAVAVVGDDRPCGAIGAVYPTSRASEHQIGRIARALRATADEIAAALG